MSYLHFSCLKYLVVTQPLVQGTGFLESTPMGGKPTLSASLKSNACSFLRVPPPLTPRHTHSAASPTSAGPRPSVHVSPYLLPCDGTVLPRKPGYYSIYLSQHLSQTPMPHCWKERSGFKFCGYFQSALRCWELGHQVGFQGCGCALPGSPASHTPPRPPQVPPTVWAPRWSCPRASRALALPLQNSTRGVRAGAARRPGHLPPEAGLAWARFCDALPGVRPEGGEGWASARRWPPGPGRLRAAGHGVGGAAGARGRGEDGGRAPEVWGPRNAGRAASSPARRPRRPADRVRRERPGEAAEAGRRGLRLRLGSGWARAPLVAGRGCGSSRSSAFEAESPLAAAAGPWLAPGTVAAEGGARAPELPVEANLSLRV